MTLFLTFFFPPCLQLQDLIRSADHVLTRCSNEQAADLKAKQQAIATNWKALKSKVQLRKELLEKAHKLYQFQAQVSTSSFCPPVHRGMFVSHRYTSELQRLMWIAAGAICVINWLNACSYLERY